ncbi:MFS transporter [Bartonella sp. DGB1]|uniref:MFS transporter n=1 Tax=Bartonella sp. DGB1 TaxID=3239807 RepID=UPI003526B45F
MNFKSYNLSFRKFSILLSIACGLIVANLYYSQPLTRNIGYLLGISPFYSSFIPAFVQLGYAFSLLFILPITGSINNKLLILLLCAINFTSLFLFNNASSWGLLLILSFFIGLSGCLIQLILSYIKNNFPASYKRKAIGNILTGIIIAILFARPLASFSAQIYSWRLIYCVSAIAIFIIFLLLSYLLPNNISRQKNSYKDLAPSLKNSLLNKKFIHISLYHSLIFACYNLFWIIIPLHLLSPIIGLNQEGVTLFYLAAIFGISVTPFITQYLDKKCYYILSGLATFLIILSFLLAHIAPVSSVFSLILLIIAAIIIDIGLVTNFIIGQKIFASFDKDTYEILNKYYLAIFFIGGALGTIIGGFSYNLGGLPLATQIGALLSFMIFLYYLTQKKLYKDM